MPILIRYAPSSLTREQYDKVNEILQENGPGGPPPALQLHVMFGEGSDLRVSEIWESEDAWQQAWDGGIKPALNMAGVELPEPDKFPVHEVWGSRGRPHIAPTSRFVARPGRCPFFIGALLGPVGETVPITNGRHAGSQPWPVV